MKIIIYIGISLINLLVFFNGHFILVATDINKNGKLKQYEDKYNINMKNKLCQTIKNY